MEANHFTILWCFLPYIDMNQPHTNMCLPILNPPPTSSPLHPSGLSQSTSSGCSALCIKLELVIYLIYGNIAVSMLFSQIIPPFPSPAESKILFFTYVVSFADLHIGSSLLSFQIPHIYVLIYSIFFLLLTYFTLSNRLKFHPPH